MTLEEKVTNLKSKGVLLTIQRYAILGFLQDNELHPTAEEIYQSLRDMYPALSRATVYNTLDLFKQHGIIQELTIEREKAHYDHRIDPHHHFFCRLCGRIYDVTMTGYPLDKGQLLEGHRVEEVRLYLIGTCSECLQEGEHAGTP